MNEFSLIELSIAGTLLATFGITYNAIVHHFESQQADLWGYTSLFVALGTLITLMGTWYFIGTSNFLIVVGAFFCTGLPMIFGSVWRYISSQTKYSFTISEINREALETAEKILQNGHITEARKT